MEATVAAETFSDTTAIFMFAVFGSLIFLVVTAIVFGYMLSNRAPSRNLPMIGGSYINGTVGVTPEVFVFKVQIVLPPLRRPNDEPRLYPIDEDMRTFQNLKAYFEKILDQFPFKMRLATQTQFIHSYIKNGGNTNEEVIVINLKGKHFSTVSLKRDSAGMLTVPDPISRYEYGRVGESKWFKEFFDNHAGLISLGVIGIKPETPEFGVQPFDWTPPGRWSLYSPINTPANRNLTYMQAAPYRT